MKKMWEGASQRTMMKKSKLIYDNTHVPKELFGIVCESIRKMDEKKKDAQRSFGEESERMYVTGGNVSKKDDAGKQENSFPRRGKWKILTPAAAALICFGIGLNSNSSFAMEMGRLPIVGPLARVLTIRSYEEQNEDTGIHWQVKEPAVEVEEYAGEYMPQATEEGTDQPLGDIAEPSLAVEVNEEIEQIVDRHLAKAEQDFLEYKQAFFATGGTEEEWAGRTMDVKVDYEIKFQSGARVSFVLYLTEAWVASDHEEYYYNLDLAENREITLEDILGPDYVKIANESILTQMEERMAENDNYVYWGIGEEREEPAIEGFTTVDENTAFYINERGNPVIAFPKYEVAPGFMGVQEFEIVRQ